MHQTKGESRKNNAQSTKRTLGVRRRNSFRFLPPSHPGGPLEAVIRVGLLTSGMSALSGVPTYAAFPFQRGAVACGRVRSGYSGGGRVGLPPIFPTPLMTTHLLHRERSAVKQVVGYGAEAEVR